MSRLDDGEATIFSGVETTVDKNAANQWRRRNYSLFLGTLDTAQHAVQLEDTFLEVTRVLRQLRGLSGTLLTRFTLHLDHVLASIRGCMHTPTIISKSISFSVKLDMSFSKQNEYSPTWFAVSM